MWPHRVCTIPTRALEKYGNRLQEKIFLGHKVRIENGNELSFRTFQSGLQGSCLKPSAMRAMQIADIVAILPQPADVIADDSEVSSVESSST